MSTFSVRRASVDDVTLVAPLFDAYRVFYERPSDLETSTAFLHARLANGDSIVFLAEDERGEALGFVQLFPLFSTTAATPGKYWLLNDLYVAEAHRVHGVGRALMERAERLARETDAVGLTLTTAIDNLRAQRLYESMDYRRDTRFFTYERTL